MGKTRVHLLAKELGMETKALVAQLDKLGMRGRKAQSSLEDDEVARVRAALASQEKPQVHVGKEIVVADRVVKAEDESLGDIEARETIVERRVRANVIRRRTSRVEVPQAEKQRSEAEVSKAPVAEPQPCGERPEVTRAPVKEVPAQGAPEVETPEEELLAAEAEPQETSTPFEAREAEPPAAANRAQIPEKRAPIEEEAPRGARILGRIDLRRTVRVEPAPTPIVRRPAPGAPAITPTPGVEVQRLPRDLDKEKTAAGEEARPAKPGRQKKRVGKKQDVLEFREKELRSGRIPRKKRALLGKEQLKTEITVPRASKRVIKISEVISVGDLAREMGVKAGEVIKKLMGLGMMATINQVLDADTATLIASEFDHQVENVAFDVESALEIEHQTEEPESALEPRPPVVTIMGHVDHGKTSLLDAIRSTNVAEGEAGGITQHIGAYTVEVNGRQVTFLDTPGHEAFTAMRARGAKVTDIVVLVVAADDGVMPQTVEAINHARAAEVPIIVAINKIDKRDANPEHVKQALGNHGLAPEEWGGDTIMVPVSAKTKEGIAQLLDMILLQADVLELKASPGRLAKGTIVEARLDRGRGPVATVLVQEGTLRPGDAFVCGTQYGRVRAMMSDKGQRIEEAGPSTPVEILGLGGVPEAGDTFVAVQDDQKARQVAEHRRTKQREAEMAKTAKVSLDDLYQQSQTRGVHELKVVLKADVQGSVEATSDALRRLSTDDVRLNVLHGSVGGITESDVLLASASNAVVIGFNVRPEPKAAALAEREGVDIRLYTIIYEALNDVRDALEGLLEPTLQEKVLGRAEVRQAFTVSGIGQVAGCFVTDGKILRGARARLLRDHVVVHDGRIASLKRFKEDVREVAGGYECGMSFEGYQDVKAGDVIEAYEVEQVARRLAPAAAKGAQAAERTA